MEEQIFKTAGRICPLFWQHGENREVLRNEVFQMAANGIRSFIVEARPHPDYLSHGWWRDLDILIEAAHEKNMGVWIFDDGAYPTGFAGGKIKALYPEALKIYLKKYQVDAVGPLPGSYLDTGRIPPEESLLCVIAARRTDGGEALDESSLEDITDRMRDGRLYWDIPEGAWRIFFLVRTREGGEERTKDYVNPIDRAAVRKFIDVIYEEHYRRYKDEFGKTIKGFFMDEPRFGNARGHCIRLGDPDIVLPYSEELTAELSRELGEPCLRWLPLLWSRESESCPDVHYAYMNTVSRMFAHAFTGQVGDWCRAHGVALLGHVVEDDGAHARLGYGCGHFFRAMQGFDASGLDIVCQIWPEYTSGRYHTPFGYVSAEFFYWGLAKMASSAAHLDAKKHDRTMCEIFGAYGWQEGLKLMKWLTDHAAVRGVNLLVPHAFTPKEGDTDCPPHFYARGDNPQWPYFKVWAEYANRVCGLLSTGTHRAEAAVLYHAEAEWGGDCQPFEIPVKTLLEHQIDCDVIPADALCDPACTSVRNGRLCVGDESYGVLVIPRSEFLPEPLLQSILGMAKQGLPVVFLEQLPVRPYLTRDTSVIRALQTQDSVFAMRTENLSGWMEHRKFCDLQPVGQILPHLRCLRMDTDGRALYFLVNESRRACICTEITFRTPYASLAAYDALQDAWFSPEKCGNAWHLELSPYQSVFLLEGRHEPAGLQVPVSFSGDSVMLDSAWDITLASAGTPDRVSSLHTLENLAAPELVPRYSGKIVYSTSFSLAHLREGARVFLDLGDVFETADVSVNGKPAGVRICPPYTYDITGLVSGENTLRVEVVNTLAKERGANRFDGSMPQEPSGLLGPVRVVIETNN